MIFFFLILNICSQMANANLLAIFSLAAAVAFLAMQIYIIILQCWTIGYWQPEDYNNYVIWCNTINN